MHIMKFQMVLIIDALINFILGILLLLVIPFPGITQFLGVPEVSQAFYPSIMGAVFIGIGFALLIEAFRKNPQGLVGLGLGGAVAINLCGGIVLAAWLCFGSLDLPTRGFVILWGLVLLLVGISSLEAIAQAGYRRRQPEE